ncbi:hypothetical protein C2E23DRAFT_847938 [Lenzites betulinus]|nr:hypothetical protein C2E23DRAFT_847938 [Lenzites betulinus]
MTHQSRPAADPAQVLAVHSSSHAQAHWQPACPGSRERACGSSPVGRSMAGHGVHPTQSNPLRPRPSLLPCLIPDTNARRPRARTHLIPPQERR